MMKSQDGFKNFLNAYFIPYYKIHQQAFTVFAVFGLLGNAFFYLFIKYYSGYWDSFWLRLINALLLASIYFFPRHRDLRKFEYWVLEMILCLALPVTFTILLMMSGVNQFYSISLMFAVTIYGLLSDPIKGLFLFPVAYFTTLFIGIQFFDVPVQVFSIALEMFLVIYLVAVIVGALQVVIRLVILELEQKNKIIEANKLELQRDKDFSDRASEAKTRFLANMSHEIRTPLNAIIGFSQILSQDSQKYNFSQEALTLLSYIKMAGENLTELINNVLDLSKIEAGKMEVNNESINLEELIKGIYNLNNHQAKQKGLKFEYSIDSKISENIIIDSVKLNQVLSNLISNAIKFSKEGKVQIKVQLQSNELLFVVSDEGIGISKDRQDAIFNAFEQEDNTTTRKFGGSGLGLAICKRMVEFLDGKIWLESATGSGSTFFVKTPYRPSEIKQKTLMELSEVATKFDGMMVMVVEDDPMNQLVIKGMLKKMHLKMQMANNGLEALELLEKFYAERNNPDLIFMDLHMPQMDGIEALRRIKVDNRWMKIPVVALTADALDEQRNKGMKEGFSAYITKPLLLENLYKVLSQFLVPEKIQIEK